MTTVRLATLNAVSDDVPSYPLGPRGPEDETPGPRVGLSRDQARFVGVYVASVDGASSVELEERGAGYLELAIFDKEGVEIARRTVFPGDNRL